MTIDRETVIRMAEDCKRFAKPFKRSGYDGPYLDLVDSIDKLTALVLEHGRKPLTDEQINKLGSDGAFAYWKSSKAIVRAIEAAHGITNKESSDAEQ